MSGFNDSRDSGYNSFNSYSDPGCSKKPDNAVSSHSSRKEKSGTSLSSSYTYDVYRGHDESSDDDWRPAGGSGGYSVEPFPYQDPFKGVSLVKDDKVKEEEERKREEKKTLSPEELQKREERIKKAKEEREFVHGRLSAYNDYFEALFSHLSSLEMSKEPIQNLEDMKEIVAAIKYINEVIAVTKKDCVDEASYVWRYQAQLAQQKHWKTGELEEARRDISLKLEKCQEKLEKAAYIGPIFIKNKIKGHKDKLEELVKELKLNVVTLGDLLKYEVFSGNFLSQSTPQEVLPELINGVVEKYWTRLHTKELMAGYIEKKIEDKVDKSTRHLAPSGFSSGPSTSRQAEKDDEAGSKLKNAENEKCEETAQEQPDSSQADVAPIKNGEGVAQDVPSQNDHTPAQNEAAPGQDTPIKDSEEITQVGPAPAQNGPAPGQDEPEIIENIAGVAQDQDVPSQNAPAPAHNEPARGQDEPAIIKSLEKTSQYEATFCQNASASAQVEAAPYQNQPALIGNVAEVPQNLSAPCQNDSGLARYDAPAAQNQAPPCQSDSTLAQNENTTGKVDPAAIGNIEQNGENVSAAAQGETGPVHNEQAPAGKIVEVPQTAPCHDELAITDVKVDSVVEEISVEFETKVSVQTEVEEIEQCRARESDDEEEIQQGPSSQLTANSPAKTQTTAQQSTGKGTKRAASPKAQSSKRAKTGNVQDKKKEEKKAADSPDLETRPIELEDMDDLPIAYVAIGGNFYGEDGSKLADSQKMDLAKVDQVAFGSFPMAKDCKEADIVEKLLKRSKSPKDAAPSTSTSKDTASQSTSASEDPSPSTSPSKDATPSTSASTSKDSSKSPKKETRTQVVIFYKYPTPLGDWEPYEATRVSQWMNNILGKSSNLDATKLRNEAKFSEAVKDGSLCRALLNIISEQTDWTLDDWGSDGPTEEQAKEVVKIIKNSFEENNLNVKVMIKPQDIIDGDSKKMLKTLCDVWVDRKALKIQNLLGPDFNKDFTKEDRDKGKERLEKMVDSFKNCLPDDCKLKEEYYDYFLIDKKLLVKAGKEYSLKEFCNAIFYVGKGKGARSEKHFEDAREAEEEKEKEKEIKISRKLGTIQKGWKDGQRDTGYFRFAEKSSELKSLIVEASIIDYLGPDELSNKKKGDWQHVINSVLGGEKGEKIKADTSKKEVRQIAAHVLQEALDKFNKEQDIVCPEKKP